MHASRMVAAAVLATVVGCSVGTPNTTSTKTSASAKPKTTASTNISPINTVTVAPPRDGHALKWVETKPAAGIKVKNNSGALTYTPDPPDAQVTLQVPDTSLGGRFKMLEISYDAPGATIPKQQWPMALQIVEPGPIKVVAVPIGNAVLKSVLTGPTPPSVIVASVRFIDEAGEPLPDESGKDLVVTVNILVE